jgi:hypothetical protein
MEISWIGGSLAMLWCAILAPELAAVALAALVGYWLGRRRVNA